MADKITGPPSGTTLVPHPIVAFIAIAVVVGCYHIAIQAANAWDRGFNLEPNDPFRPKKRS